MADRLIALTDDRKRDAQVAYTTVAKAKGRRTVGPGGRAVKIERLVKATDRSSLSALLKAHGSLDGVSKALVDGDPEIDLAQAGRRLRDPARVHIRQDGSVLYAARVLRVVLGPDGLEKSRADFLDVEATVGEDRPALPWTGKLLPVDEVVRKYALNRAFQLRHVNGLTFDFLHQIAKTLQAADKMLRVGSGAKGTAPLIFSLNGAPFVGFLDGRVEGDAYRLILHLSNLELKSAP